MRRPPTARGRQPQRPPCSRTTLGVAPGNEADAGNQTRKATGRAIYELSEAGSAEGFSETHGHLLEKCGVLCVDHRGRKSRREASSEPAPRAMISETDVSVPTDVNRLDGSKLMIEGVAERLAAHQNQISVHGFSL